MNEEKRKEGESEGEKGKVSYRNLKKRKKNEIPFK